MTRAGSSTKSRAARLGDLLDLLVALTWAAHEAGDNERQSILDARYCRAEDAYIAEWNEAAA